MAQWQRTILKILGIWCSLLICAWLVFHPALPATCVHPRRVQLPIGYHCTWNWTYHRWHCAGEPAFNQVYLTVCYFPPSSK